MPARTERTTIVVGIDDAAPVPLQAGKSETGDFRGYEVDLLNGLATKLCVSIFYRRAEWSALMEVLKAGELDLICSAATVTTERAEEVSFCKPHLKFALALVTSVGAPRVDLRQSRIGVRGGTTAESYFRKTIPDRVPFMTSESNLDLYAALAARKLSAVIDDSRMARHFSALDKSLHFEGRLSGTEGEYAVVLQKGNIELRVAINRAIEQLEADRTLPRSREFWFGSSAAVVS